jgi:hypothetical protein
MRTSGMTFGPKHSWFESQHAPIIIMRFPDHFRDDELEEALRAVTEWLLESVDRPFGFIVDMQRPLVVSAKQREMMAACEKAYAHVDRRYNGGQAVIVSNPLIRGVVTAIYWIAPPVYPVKTLASMAQAMSWLRPQLDAALKQFPNGPIWQRKR